MQSESKGSSLPIGTEIMNFVTVYGLVAIYCLLTGMSIVAFWFNLMIKKQLISSRFPQKPAEIAYHVVAEFATAIFLAVSAVGMILDYGWARILTPVSLGMLLYAEVNGADFYASQKKRGMVVVFYTPGIFTAAVILAFVFYGLT